MKISELKFKPIPNYGDLFTIESFRKNVKSGDFIDYDGHGVLSDGKQIAQDFIVYPFQFKKGKVSYGNLWETQEIIDIPKWVTHIVWFNR